MKRAVLVWLFWLAGGASFSAPVIPAQATSAAAPPVIGKFKNPRYEAAGCWFYLSADYRRPDAEYIFFTENFTDAIMKIDGQEVRLTLRQQSPRNLAQRLGRKTWEVYSNGAITVRIDQTLLRRHPRGASTESRATFTVTRGEQKQSLPAKGNCGC